MGLSWLFEWTFHFCPLTVPSWPLILSQQSSPTAPKTPGSPELPGSVLSPTRLPYPRCLHGMPSDQDLLSVSPTAPRRCLEHLGA